MTELEAGRSPIACPWLNFSPSFPNSIWERNCPRNFIASASQREMEFREEQGTFPNGVWE